VTVRVSAMARSKSFTSIRRAIRGRSEVGRTSAGDPRQLASRGRRAERETYG
jgi:hypothetical protein